MDTAHQLNSIRSQLTPLLNSRDASNISAVPLPSPRVASPPASTTPGSISHPLSQLAIGKVPPPPPSPFRNEKASSPSPPSRDTVKALWAFDAAGGPDELRFSVDEVIEVLDRSDKDWWRGKTKDGREGLFPANYVETVASPPSYAANGFKSNNGGGDTEKRWKPPTAKWSSGSTVTPPPTAPANGTPSANNGTTPLYGGYALADPNAPVPAPGQSVMVQGPNGLQPYVPTEEERKKHEKFKKIGGRVGMAAASGAGFGLGVSVGGWIMNRQALELTMILLPTILARTGKPRLTHVLIFVYTSISLPSMPFCLLSFVSPSLVTIL